MLCHLDCFPELPTCASQVAGSLAVCNHGAVLRNWNLKLTFYGLKGLGLHFFSLVREVEMVIELNIDV